MIDCVVSASAVVSDIPPEGCGVGGPTYGAGGGTKVDGPASAFLCSFARARDIPYGWYRPVRVSPALVGPALG